MALNPLNWPASPFLTLYAAICIAIWVFILVSRSHIGEGRDDGAPLTPIELAFLAGGRNRAADTILVGLFEAGTLATTTAGKIFTATTAGAAPAWLPAYAGLPSTPIHHGRLNPKIRKTLSPVQQGLQMRGLAPTAAQRRTYFITAASAGIAFGAAKIHIGHARGHPTGFLTFLVFALALVSFIIATAGPARTSAGTRALRRAKRQNPRAARAPVGDEIMLAFALTGAAVLAGRPYRPFFLTPSDTGGGSGGCGGSGCGGGGCGGCS